MSKYREDMRIDVKYYDNGLMCVQSSRGERTHWHNTAITEKDEDICNKEVDAVLLAIHSVRGEDPEVIKMRRKAEAMYIKEAERILQLVGTFSIEQRNVLGDIVDELEHMARAVIVLAKGDSER